MKLLFIENRYKTYFFDAVAAQLQQLGHDIYWIVQNPIFTPKTGEINVIPFPSKHTKTKITVDISDILESDRQLNFFNKKDTTYFYYYYDQIKNQFKKIAPDLTFGESTQFHELITAKICRDEKALYLHPSSCRYPSGRFSFYKFDTVEPYLGSQEKLMNKEANKIIASIVNRSSKPDYMKKVPLDRKKTLKDKAKILKGYLQGEIYNTPPPIVKFKREKQKKQNIIEWNSKSTNKIDKDHFSLLYPLHLQPEANIDVWGRPRRDQFKNIRAITESLQDGQKLYVKPNPKSKYELSKKLIDFIESQQNVEMLHHETEMDAVFNDIDLFITVNGTIALECIFANKPVLTLVKVFFNRARNCLYLQGFTEIQVYIERIKKNNFPVLSEEEKIDFLNLLNRTSYSGIISDPYSSRASVSPENIRIVTSAFQLLLKSYHDQKSIA